MPGQITIPLNATLPATYDTQTGECSWLQTRVITGRASNGLTNWSNWQILAAPSGSSAAYIRAARPINDTEVGYLWANANESGDLLNRWLCFMSRNNNNLEWHGAMLGLCMWLSSANGS